MQQFISVPQMLGTKKSITNCNRTCNGFTLLEILIALFIYTIVSLILANALHQVIQAQLSTEKKAQELRQLQMVFLIMSRDIEQTINRPIANVQGREEAAWLGTSKNFFFTRGGYGKPIYLQHTSALQRIGYSFTGDSLIRKTFTVLDQAPDTQAETRVLLTDVKSATFEYLDSKGRFHEVWPQDAKESLPRAVRVRLHILDRGKISQLYVIPAEPHIPHADSATTETSTKS